MRDFLIRRSGLGESDTEGLESAAGSGIFFSRARGEMADALDSGSSGATRGGSNPLERTDVSERISTAGGDPRLGQGVGVRGPNPLEPRQGRGKRTDASEIVPVAVGEKRLVQGGWNLRTSWSGPA